VGEVSVSVSCACASADAVKCFDGLLKELAERYKDRFGASRVDWASEDANFELELLTPMGKIALAGVITVAPPEITIRGPIPKRWWLPEQLVRERFEEYVKRTWESHCPGRSCPKAL
jgi:hypothetical protein